MFVFVAVYDFGVIQNRIFKREYYRPGDILQLHIQIGACHIWIEQYAVNAPPVLYRVGFGARPSISPLMPKADAQKALERFVAGVSHV